MAALRHRSSASPTALGPVQEQVTLKPTLAEASSTAKAAPNSATNQLALGHAAYAAGRPGSALKAYDRALALDVKVADDRLVQNLVASFRTPQIGAAAAIISRYALAQASQAIELLSRNKSYLVRSTALNTLEKLGPVSKATYVSVALLDLDVPECEARRAALTRLGELGDPSALPLIREAKRKDDENTPWYAARCLGNRALDAQRSILGRRSAPPQAVATKR